MSLTVIIAIVLWFVCVPLFFIHLSRRRAILVSIATGWMFLPVATIAIPGLPDINKEFLTCVPIFLLCFAIPAEGWKVPRFDIQDGLVAAFCLTPLFSSLANGLGLYDGVASSLDRLPMWLYPYLLGRFYFHSAESLRTMCWALLIAGIVYMPFCLWEIRMSPQLHKQIYGFAQKEFLQSVRGSTYRPVVFMHTGLTVSMWMMMACFCGVQLWRTRQMPYMEKLPFFLQPRLLLFILIGVFILCKSWGAVILFMAACLVFELARLRRSKFVLLCLVALPIAGLYVKLNAANVGVEQEVVSFFEGIDTERAGSLQFRIDNEELLREKALEKPIFGWGGWGGAFIYNEYGEKTSVTDGCWIIILGANGLVGVFLLWAVILTPSYRYIRRFPKTGWQEPRALLTLAVMVILPCYAVDALINDMRTPLYMLIAGSVTSLVRATSLVEERKEELVARPVTALPAFRYL